MNPAGLLSSDQRRLMKVKKALSDFFDGLRQLYTPAAPDGILTARNDDALVLVRLSPLARSLVTRCADLFFFYQEGAPF